MAMMKDILPYSLTNEWADRELSNSQVCLPDLGLVLVAFWGLLGEGRRCPVLAQMVWASTARSTCPGIAGVTDAG